MRVPDRPSVIDYAHVRASRARKAAGFKADPSKALITKSVTIRPVDSFRKCGRVRDFEVFSDEPDTSGGGNSAPQPTEYMLLSLGFCQMSMLVAAAAAMRIEVPDYEMRVTGYRDDRAINGVEGARCGYYRIDIETVLRSDAPSERLQRLVGLAESMCSVYDNLAHPTSIHTRVLRDAEVLLEHASELTEPS